MCSVESSAYCSSLAAEEGCGGGCSGGSGKGDDVEEGDMGGGGEEGGKGGGEVGGTELELSERRKLCCINNDNVLTI